MKSSLYCFLLFISGIYSHAQDIARPVPNGLLPYEFTDSGFNGTGCFLFTCVKTGVVRESPNYVNPVAMICDADGYLTWYWTLSVSGIADFKYHPAIGQYTLSVLDSATVKFLVLDNQFNLVDTLEPIHRNGDIHDIRLAKNGNWLLCTAPLDTIDLSEYTFDGQRGGLAVPIVGFGVQEIDQAGNLIFEWNSNEHINPGDFYAFYKYNPSSFDYCHGNAIEEDEDGHLLFSFRHLNAIYKIHRTTGSVIWILGGVSSDFVFVNDQGFSGQHDIHRLPNGFYSLYDNSNIGPAPQKSRGVEFALDTVNWIATRMEEVVHSDSGYYAAMGSYTKFPNGESLINWGLSYRPQPSISYFDANRNILAEFFLHDSVMSYRASYNALSALKRPQISCTKIGERVVLSAPDSKGYSWSTGEITQCITIEQPGVYQVWIPSGVGQLGSYPFVVTDLHHPCGPGNYSKWTKKIHKRLCLDKK